MASIGTDRNGHRRILIVAEDGRRPTLRLGKVTAEVAKTVCKNVEALQHCRANATEIDRDLAKWVRKLPDKMHKRLADIGLVEPRVYQRSVTLGALLDRYVASATCKPSTLAAHKQAVESLRAHFGHDFPLCKLTAAHADGWRQSLAGSKLATATIAKRVKTARTIFLQAVRWGLMPSSPFDDLKTGSQSNPDRLHYVTPENINAILDVCPDDEWRAIILLTRYAGLRCPSELCLLRWSDVNWERLRLNVRSPKTEAHEGHAVRIVPIVPELYPVLLRLFEAADDGAERVLPTRVPTADTNLRTHMLRLLKRASVKPWPRLFQNLRSSCETDWCERFPAHVAASWVGHSTTIAAKHYLQTRDAHFDMATGKAMAQAGSDGKWAQNPAQHTAANTGNDPQGPKQKGQISGDCEHLQPSAMPSDGPAGIRTPDQSIMSRLL